MKSNRDFSIRTKLVLLSVISVSAALMVSFIGFALTDVQTMQYSAIRSLSTQARMLAFNSTAVLSFNQPEAARQLLESLKSQPTIEFACLYDNKGTVMATYSKDSRSDMVPPPPQDSGYRFLHGVILEMYWKVVDGGEFVGTLYLRENTSVLRDQLFYFLKIAALVMLASLTVAGLLAARLQRVLSQPILALARTAVQITTGGDYSIRVHSDAHNELGKLYDAFNMMLARVETSEKKLLATHNILEEKVLERTAELRREIVDKERAQSELERAKQIAENATRSKSEFLANMSHEIRTPITAILGFVEVLLEERKSDWGKDELATIKRNGEYLLSIINDILDISKIEAQRMKVEHIACSPIQLISDVNSLMLVRAAAKDLALKVEFNSSMPETIKTDPTRLRQILINVINNGIKFTEAGEVKIVVTFFLSDHPIMQFDVIDTGIGMTSDETKCLFEKFSQGEKSTSRRFGGTGLGLAISKRLAELLGGDVILVRSQPGLGSHFRITIATGLLEDVAILDMPNLLDLSENVRHASAWREVPQTISLHGKVLLAEDGPDNQRLISHILRKAGLDVTIVDDGKDAFDAGMEALKNGHPYDLILMDMQMPIMDGYEATVALRRNGYNGAIVALTAHAMANDREKCLEAGCNDYASKPIQRQEFFAMLKKYITNSTAATSDQTLP